MSDKKKHNPTAVVIVNTDCRGNQYFSSVAEASRQTGLPRNRLFEALASKTGLVKWTDPPVYIDLAAQPYDVEKPDEDEGEE